MPTHDPTHVDDARKALIHRLVRRDYTPVLRCVVKLRGLHALSDESLALIEKALDLAEVPPPSGYGWDAAGW